MKTALLFLGIIFPVVSAVVIDHVDFIDGTAFTFTVASVCGMLMIFFSGRYEAAAVFYLAVAMSNMKSIMLPMYIPFDAMGYFAHFLMAMYLGLFITNRRSH